MKWALIYLLAAYGSGGNVVLWDTGFRYSSYDECTLQGISIAESSKPKQEALGLRKGGKHWKKYGGNRSYRKWRCMPSKD